MSSPSPFGGSLYRILEFLNDINAKPLGIQKFICDEILGSSRGMTQGLGILEFLGNFRIYSRNSSFRNSRIPISFYSRNFSLGNSRLFVIRSPDQVGGCHKA